MSVKKGFGFKAALAAAALVAVLAIGGIYAYLTYTQSVTNTFTVGKVEAELTEPAWTAAGDEAHRDIYPGQTIAKDPTVTMGAESNPAVVFMEVTYPKKEVITVGAGGTRNAAAATELFTPGELGTGWVELTAKQKSDSAAGTVTRVYGLKNELGAGASSTLFESVTFANVVEGQVIDDVAIGVKADVIQAGGMEKAGDAYTEGELGAIYDRFVAQNAAP